jgi:hypothetical protein
MHCHKKGCDKPFGKDDHWFCTDHRNAQKAKLKAKEDKLIDYQLNDPLYMQDREVYLKCIDCIPPLPMEEDDHDSFEELNCLSEILFTLLFEVYYTSKIKNTLYLSAMKFNPGTSRTQLIIDLVKHLKTQSVGKSRALWEMKDIMQAYKSYTIFLERWVEEQKIIDKNLLISELNLIYDVKKLVKNIINKL